MFLLTLLIFLQVSILPSDLLWPSQLLIWYNTLFVNSNSSFIILLSHVPNTIPLITQRFVMKRQQYHNYFKLLTPHIINNSSRTGRQYYYTAAALPSVYWYLLHPPLPPSLPPTNPFSTLQSSSRS